MLKRFLLLLIPLLVSCVPSTKIIYVSSFEDVGHDGAFLLATDSKVPVTVVGDPAEALYHKSLGGWVIMSPADYNGFLELLHENP